MSKLDRIYNKIKRLEIKKAEIEFKIGNLETEYNFWKEMEDDSGDWECDE